MDDPRVHLEIGERASRIVVDGGSGDTIVGVGHAPGARFTLPVGCLDLVPGPFRRDPPAEGELEAAIAVVEDAVMPLVRHLPPALRLRLTGSAAARVAAACGVAGGGVLSLDAVENLFGRICASLDFHAPTSP